jgi:hypothetical protein
MWPVIRIITRPILNLVGRKFEVLTLNSGYFRAMSSRLYIARCLVLLSDTAAYIIECQRRTRSLWIDSWTDCVSVWLY